MHLHDQKSAFFTQKISIICMCCHVKSCVLAHVYSATHCNTLQQAVYWHMSKELMAGIQNTIILEFFEPSKLRNDNTVN